MAHTHRAKHEGSRCWQCLACTGSLGGTLRAKLTLVSGWAYLCHPPSQQLVVLLLQHLLELRVPACLLCIVLGLQQLARQVHHSCSCCSDRGFHLRGGIACSQ